MTNSKLIPTIEDRGTTKVETLLDIHDVFEKIPVEPDSNSLEDAQQRIIEILELTGQDIFDDEAQWHTYRSLIAALYIIDKQVSPNESQSLEEYVVERKARGNYNPLAKVGETDNQTVEELADAYRCGERLPDDWEANPALAIQNLLGSAILDLNFNHYHRTAEVEYRIAAAMNSVDAHFGTQTALKIETVTQTAEGIDGDPFEYDAKQLTTFQQEATTA